MMRISSVQIENFLSFRDNILVNDIRPISVFVGPNNAGKSNFIRTLKFYQNLLLDTREPYTKYYRINDKFHKLNIKKPFSILIRYKVDDPSLSPDPLEVDHFLLYNGEGIFDKERFSLRKDNKERTVIKKEKQGETFMFYEQDKDLVEEFLFGTRGGKWTTSPEGIFNSVNFSNYAPFLWPNKNDNPGIRIYNEIKKYIENWIFIPDDRIKDINERLKRLKTELPRDREYTNILLDQMNRLIGVRDISIDEKNDELTCDIKESRDISTPLAESGSGLQQIVVMYPQLFEKNVNNTVIFIEEPESHLHPILQRKLLQAFIKKSESNQFFITTHSTIFCGFQENKLRPYLVKKANYSTSIKGLDKKEINKVKVVLGHVNTDLFNCNAVLFVEGPTEFEAIPLLAANLDIDIVNEGILLLNSSGYGNMVQLKNIINLLKDNLTEVYAMSDNHDSEQRKLKDVEDSLDRNNYVKLEKSFEDSFDSEILVQALKDIIEEEGHTFENSETTNLKKDLESTESLAIEILNKHYWQKTKRGLSKISLGQAIGNVLANNNLRGKSIPEKLLIRIHNKVYEQMNMDPK